MPICTAVIAAALLSSPVSSTPADPVPASGAKAGVAPGKQIAQLAMKNPEEPELIAGKAMELLKGKGTKVGPTSSGSTQPRQNANGDGGSGEGGPQDVFLTGGNKPMSFGGSKPKITGDYAPEKGDSMPDRDDSAPAKDDAANDGFGIPTITKANKPLNSSSSKAPGKQSMMPAVFGEQFASSFAWPKVKDQAKAKAKDTGRALSKDAKKSAGKDDDWWSDWS
ncbi:hypothetical protein JOL79_23925 [Microbispora sp. RL4-1S]|uniref:Uncharacterized protein n=1 Tax=Microbispora oryzae TaxID=2806554 RepID=A0A940WSZ1_9ACTN|nr:hypothetical protein [Microbispora oryzae]MBP2706860.1 hypothetical protein [Microbispora oryzae]